MKSILLLAFIVATANTAMGQEDDCKDLGPYCTKGEAAGRCGWKWMKNKCKETCGLCPAKCPQPNTFLGGCPATGCAIFDSVDDAKAECLKVSDCGGITVYPNGKKAELRKATKGTPSPKGETSMLKTCFEYILVASNSSCDRITTVSECSAAASVLNPSNTTPIESAFSYSPPNCFVYIGTYGRTLYFNPNGESTASCTEKDQCLCKAE